MEEESNLGVQIYETLLSPPIGIYPRTTTRPILQISAPYMRFGKSRNLNKHMRISDLIHAFPAKVDIYILPSKTVNILLPL